MNLKASLTCVLLIAVTVVSCGRVTNKSPYYKTVPSANVCSWLNKQIQIFHPQGLMVKQRVTKTLHSLELEMYINQKYRNNPSCDICANVTVPSRRSKRLILKDEVAVIRPGDTVQYTITKRYRQGPPKRFSCEFQPNVNLIKFAHQTKSLRSCPRKHAVHQTRNDTAEKTLLEETINDLLASCDAVNRNTKLALTGDFEEFVSDQAIKRYVVDRLSTLLPSVNWHQMVGNVSYYPDKIIFDVQTSFMKLKILHTIQGTNVAKLIVDFEEPNHSAVVNGESSDEYDEYDNTTDVFDIDI